MPHYCVIMPTNRPFALYLRCGSRVCNRAAVVVFLGAFRSPHSRLRRQYGVIHNVTARAVNIAENQMATIMIVGAYGNTPKSLSQKPQKGDRLTQIHWIYKIFLRKSAISARDYPCHLPCHTPIKVDELGCFGAFCKMTLWWSIIIIWRRSRRLRRIARSCAGNLLWCRSVMLMIRWSRILFSY